jgi:hypothetical protein
MILITTTGFKHQISSIDFTPGRHYADIVYLAGPRGAIEIAMIASITDD